MKNGIYLGWDATPFNAEDFSGKYFHDGAMRCLVIVRDEQVLTFLAMTDKDILKNKKDYDAGKPCRVDISRTSYPNTNALTFKESERKNKIFLKTRFSSDENFVNMLWDICAPGLISNEANNEQDEGVDIVEYEGFSEDERINRLYFQCHLVQNIVCNYPMLNVSFLKVESYEHFGKFVSCDYKYKNYCAKFNSY